MRLFVLLFGVLLPAVALAVEVTGSACADVLFDPVPSARHALLVGLVPAANLLLLLNLDTPSPRRRAWVARLNGVALGVALVYTLLFLPILPLALIAVVFLIGFLPLAPLASLTAAAWGRARLGAAAGPGAPALPRWWVWAGVGCLLLLAADAPGALTEVGAVMAGSSSPAVRARGVGLLRKVGSRERLLALCQGGGRRPALSLSALAFDGVAALSPDQARAVFYRVTGTPYTAHARPRAGRPGSLDGPRNFDPDQGGTTVGQRIEGLSLSKSRLDVSVEGSAAVAYAEWTMRFRNAGSDLAEARAQVELPPGGVVSRLTLWVDGEPREATFAETGRVRAAYESVVVRRRDPVLVTVSGPERVLVQCYPVPAGGEMQIRLGVTAPLVRQGRPQQLLRLPRFAERNFAVPDGPAHELMVSADSPIASVLRALRRGQAGNGIHTLAGSLRDAELAGPSSVLRVSGAGPAPAVWASHPGDPGHVVVQELKVRRRPAVRRLVVVVDGSAAMAGALDDVATAVIHAPHRDVEVRLLVAGDRISDLSEWIHPDRLLRLPGRLRAAASAGGCDNVPALLRACDEAGEGPAAVVWVHAPQPIVLDPVGPLRERLARADFRVYEVPVTSGPNPVRAELGDGRVTGVVRAGPLDSDLWALIRALSEPKDVPTFTRRRVAADAVAWGEPASAHVARLWAHGRVLEMCRGPEPRADAVRLAEQYRLVTPVTGAVVLETKQQYEDAGLQQAEPEEAGSQAQGSSMWGKKAMGPEPGLWLLLGLVALILGRELWRGRMRWRGA